LLPESKLGAGEKTMPTYSYECPDCDHTFERFQPMSAKPTKVCPSCRKRKVRRLIGSGAGIIFKGSGFYQTDYRSEDYKSRAKADKSPGKSSTSSGSDKKENASSKAD